MLIHIWNIALWVDTAFSRSSDPLIAEYRGHQRQMIIGGALALLAMLVALILAGLSEDAGAVARPLVAMVVQGFVLLSLLAIAWCMWSIYLLWRLEREQ